MGRTANVLLCVLVAATVDHRLLLVPREDDRDPPAAACGPADPGGEIAVLTYNAGLGPGMVSLSGPRAPRVAEALAAADFDIACFQEVWLDADRDTIVRALGLPPQRIVAADTVGMHENGGDVCTASAIAPALACVRDRCAGGPDEEVTLCGLRECYAEVRDLYLRDGGCFNCLAASVGRGADAIAATCTGPGASRIYGGRNGVILASRLPISRPEWVPLPSSRANRVAVFARVSAPWGGSIEVACTHLSATQGVPPSVGGFTTWEEEQTAQLRIIAARLRARAGGRPALLIGDMNFGASRGSVSAQAERTWYEAKALGFRAPAAEVDPPLCSACAGNTLRSSDRSYLIDHALVLAGTDEVSLSPECAERTLDGPVDVSTLDGRVVRTHLSDHFGIRIVFVPR